jgi:putative flippase GtrA
MTFTAALSPLRNTHETTMEIVKFLIVGGSATALQYGLLIVFVQFAGLTPVAATSIAYAISSVYNYLLNYYATFKSNASHQTAAIKFAAVASSGLLINAGIIYALIKWGLHYLMAQVIATFIILVWNFVVHKYWTYRDHKS